MFGNSVYFALNELPKRTKQPGAFLSSTDRSQKSRKKISKENHMEGFPELFCLHKSTRRSEMK